MTRTISLSSVSNRAGRSVVAIVCAVLLAPGETVFLAQAAQATAPQTAAEDPKLPPDQLDALVAPIALHPDPLLSQILVASTYPLEIVQLQQWLAKNPGLKDTALADKVAKQPWDPSIQAMAALPDVVKRLGDDIQWTTELGNAFLAQQADVMDAVQRMRKKAEGTGALKTNEQQKVETKVVEQKTVIVIEQANPQIVYVPTYSPVVVYGPPVYPYPPIYYPPYYPPSTGAIVAAGLITFGVGIAIGAAWGHGGWGWGCGWGHNDININVNNNFNRNTNINRNVNANGNWNHNPQHRGGAPYANQATANKYGGTARGDAASSRQASGGQQARSGGDRAAAGGDRAAAAGDRAGAAGDRAGAGTRPTTGTGDRAGAAGDRAGAAGDRAGAAGDRAGAATRPTTGTGGGADRVGSRDVGAGRSSGGSSAFGGGSGGYSGASARTSSARGSSSAGGRSAGRSGGGGGGRR